MANLTELRHTIATLHAAPEPAVLSDLTATWGPTDATRKAATQAAIALIETLRTEARPSLMEQFLGEYGLSTEEGVALMCLAEALLRVPDADTMDALIEDKVAPSDWGKHLGRAHSPLVNASTWALFLTGKVLEGGRPMAGLLHGAVNRLGEPVIRRAARQAMKEMGRQFVLGETIKGAMDRARGQEKRGFTYSYDMLGEAAMTWADADRYLASYSNAIAAIGRRGGDDLRAAPGISVKLSALHPRYEPLNHTAVLAELTPRLLDVCQQAKAAGIGLNIDAEEAARLDLSLDVIEAVLRDDSLAGWDGFGVVVQAYGKRASAVIDWLYALAETHDRRIMVRLVKGAYWDTEIKLSQVEGHADYPVFTRKSATDASYLCCARQLLARRDRIYPQFATHNAHTVAAILAEAGSAHDFEFQRLHGMGEALHDLILKQNGTRCRIYAPVGAHHDLLAYLVRRLLENGANSSFVNQIVDTEVSAATIASDPFDQLGAPLPLPLPAALFAPERANARGWDVSNPAIYAGLRTVATTPMSPLNAAVTGSGEAWTVRNPATGEVVGNTQFFTAAEAATVAAQSQPWTATAPERAAVLNAIADLYETEADTLFALLIREAGKSILDAINELREAVDFLRYYAARAVLDDPQPLGTICCISPWNFPLAIFTGQIAGALAVGNAVIAKPAETTSLIADVAVGLMHKAGVPTSVLHLVPGRGAEVGPALCAAPQIAGVCFTGSTATAQHINRAMAADLAPGAPLIAETGGLNAMIVDSTALPEQAVRDIVASAFQSAGQRCSALRMLYIQEDVAEGVLTMLKGAMSCLKVGNTADFATDVGPVIDTAAQVRINAHIAIAQAEGRVLHQIAAPEQGTFVSPTLISVSGIADLKEEIFGPVLHVATFAADGLDDVIKSINATGYGLTFGLHSRIDDRVQHVIEQIDVGNVYVNRNQIGAVVGVQPFGGHGLSGTGPKAGGPRYIRRLAQPRAEWAQDLPSRETMPGPTGELNTLSTKPRNHILCLGPTAQDQAAQVALVKAQGGTAVTLSAAEAVIAPATLATEGVFWWGDDETARVLRQALAARSGLIVPLHLTPNAAPWLVAERCVTIDTTAAGGNVKLLAQSK